MTYGALVGQNEPSRSGLPGPISCPASPYQPQPRFHVNSPSATQYSAATHLNSSMAGRATAQTAWQSGEDCLHGSSIPHLSVPSAEPWAQLSCNGSHKGTGMAVSLAPDHRLGPPHGARARQPLEAARRAGSSAFPPEQPDEDSRMASEPTEIGRCGAGRSSTESNSNHFQGYQQGREPAGATSRLESYLQERPSQTSKAGQGSDNLTGPAASLPSNGRQQLYSSQEQPGHPPWMKPSRPSADASSYWDELVHHPGHQLPPRQQQQQHHEQDALHHLQPGMGGTGQEGRGAYDPITYRPQADSPGSQACVMHQGGMKPRGGPCSSASDESMQPSDGWYQDGPAAGGYRRVDPRADQGEGESAAWCIKARTPAWQPAAPDAAQKLLHGRPYATEHSAQVHAFICFSMRMLWTLESIATPAPGPPWGLVMPQRMHRKWLHTTAFAPRVWELLFMLSQGWLRDHAWLNSAPDVRARPACISSAIRRHHQALSRWLSFNRSEAWLQLLGSLQSCVEQWMPSQLRLCSAIFMTCCP